MPIDYQIINEDMIIVTAFGVVTRAELSDHVFSLVNLHGISLNSGYKQIFDAMKVERIDFNEEDMKHISQIVLNYGQGRGKITIAFVAINSRVREMISYYMQLCEVTDVRAELFECRQDADDWLTSV
ncbi:MAG: hypothetical protein BMS9Abin25_0307 [Gammaproteobacteria bacterium]|nr:MAG: hypothetical protein BMS9Abin25_0307 [Gammaproteobacteria bacterium]